MTYCYKNTTFEIPPECTAVPVPGVMEVRLTDGLDVEHAIVNTPYISFHKIGKSTFCYDVYETDYELDGKFLTLQDGTCYNLDHVVSFKANWTRHLA